MKLRTKGLVCVIAVSLFAPVLMGATAARMYKDGQGLEEAGKYYLAALKYLDALDKNSNHKKANAALLAVAETAYEQKLGLAKKYETERRFPDALKEYSELKSFLRRMDQVGVVDFSVVDAAAKIDEMENASAEQEYQEAESALAEGQWDQAIDYYKSAQFYKTSYKDTDEKIALAVYSRAENELEAHAYRAAAKSFLLSQETVGGAYKDATERSTQIYAALGSYFLDQGYCRQAVRDFGRARKLGGASLVGDDLSRAEECAVVPVAIMPLENPTGRNLAGMALGDAIADAISADVRKGGSDFVHIIERGALDTIFAEQGLSASGVTTGNVTRLSGVRFISLGKLTQVNVEAPDVTNVKRSSVGSQPYECQKQKSDGTNYTATCWRDVPLDYIEHTASINVRVAGSLTVVDVQSGVQVASKTFESEASDSTTWADSFTYANTTNPATVVERQRSGGIQIQERGIEEMMNAPRTIRSESDLVPGIIKEISFSAADAILDVVDADPDVRDPSSLAL